MQPDGLHTWYSVVVFAKRRLDCNNIRLAMKCLALVAWQYDEQGIGLPARLFEA